MTWTGELISQINQVVIAIFILVFVYFLIGFEVIEGMTGWARSSAACSCNFDEHFVAVTIVT